MMPAQFGTLEGPRAEEQDKPTMAKVAEGKEEFLLIPLFSPPTQSQFHDGSSLSTIKAKNAQPLRKASSGKQLGVL